MTSAVASGAAPDQFHPDAETPTEETTIATTMLQPAHDPNGPAPAQNTTRVPLSPAATSSSAATHRPVSSSSHDTMDDASSESPDQDQDGVEDQDGAQAVLQPAMSAAAIHLTSTHTPAIEKAAALDKIVRGGILELPAQDDDDDADDDDADDAEDATVDIPARRSPSSGNDPQVSPTSRPIPGPHSTGSSPAGQGLSPKQPPPNPSLTLGQLPRPDPSAHADLPSPWTSTPRRVIKDASPSQRYSRLLPARGVLESAFGPTRSRSRSTGQEALKRLQKAFPSLSSPSHLLPSLPSNFFSSSSSSSSPQSRTTGAARRFTGPGPLPSRLRNGELDTPAMQRAQTLAPSRQSMPIRPGNASSAATAATSSGASLEPRPPVLRRVTSDDSILYHSLSRASSLGDDEHFPDVREMVNMRLQAIRESLPDVPNFKMRHLPRIHTPSFKSANSFTANDGLGLGIGSRSPGIDREASASPGTPGPAASFAKDGLSEIDTALQELTGDVVVLGGFRGSVLRSAEPPHQQCWAPVKLGFNMRKVNLAVGLSDEDEERMEETIIPSGMLSHIGPIDISRKFIKKLRNCENGRAGRLRVWDYGYDWRLSPALLSRKLREFLETLPSNQPGTDPASRGALVVAHSLGGMITRHAVNQRPDLFSGVLYAGTPRRCINILGPLRNGDAVLLNEKLLSAQVNFTMRPSFAFLPEDGFCFVDKNTHEEYPIDFFDPEEWVRWRLSPCMMPALPALNQPTASPSSLSSFLPNTLRSRAESWSESWAERRSGIMGTPASATADQNGALEGSAPGHKERNLAPQMGASGGSTKTTSASPTEAISPSTPPLPSDPERQRNMEYLTRTLAATRKFRAELEHRADHQDANAYPPLAVMYSKMTPTVYGAQVNGREGIPCADAYDDLLFRAGDGVVLARESMPPEGYSVVRGGRIHTERGHITMLGDMPAVGKALTALIRGRRKGIGINMAEKKE